MATFNKVNDFVEDALNGAHDLSSDTLQIALSNTAPTSESSNPLQDGNGVLSNVTQVAYTNYSDDLTTDRVLEGVTVSLSTGTVTLSANDFTITASGGSLASFRYVYVFNQTATNDELICMWDQGSAISLANGESVTLDFGSDGGTSGTIFTLG